MVAGKYFTHFIWLLLQGPSPRKSEEFEGLAV